MASLPHGPPEVTWGGAFLPGTRDRDPPTETTSEAERRHASPLMGFPIIAWMRRGTSGAMCVVCVSVAIDRPWFCDVLTHRPHRPTRKAIRRTAEIERTDKPAFLKRDRGVSPGLASAAPGAGLVRYGGKGVVNLARVDGRFLPPERSEQPRLAGEATVRCGLVGDADRAVPQTPRV